MKKYRVLTIHFERPGCVGSSEISVPVPADEFTDGESLKIVRCTVTRPIVLPCDCSFQRMEAPK